MTEILLYFLQACALIAAVFGLWKIMGVTHLGERYSCGRGIIAVILLFTGEVLTGKFIFSSEWLAGWLFFIPWIYVFPALQARSIKNWGVPFSALRYYLEVPCAGMILLAALSQIGVYKLLFLWISFIILLISGLIVSSYILYFWVYGTAFSEGDMIPVLQTDKSETAEYIREQIGWSKLGVMSFLFILYAFLAGIILFSGNVEEIVTGQSALEYKTIILLAVCTYFLRHYGKHCFPFEEYRTAKEYMNEEKKLMKGHTEAVKKIILDKPSETTGDETVILVIGESANRDHMKAFNEGYPEETTPWLSENKEEDGFYLFRNAYSNFPQTVRSLSMYLTSKNQYTEGENTDTINIIDIARKGGYKTYWFSNQARTGESNSSATFVGSGADEAEWTEIPGGDDIRLLDMLKKIPKQEKNFIVLHLMGSHIRYGNRVPKEFIKQSGRKNQTKKEWYDTSVLYTDYILKSVYEYGKKYLNLQAMIYCSDHGENMQYGHTTAHFTFDMVRIPMFVYLSETYRNKYQDRGKNLNNNKDAIFTNDLMFDTVCGIMNLPNNFYKRKYDLSDEQYDLPLEAAVTNHGKTKISEDRLS